MDGAGSVRQAMQAYVQAVKTGAFPQDDIHSW
jgi:3-methyl-2-oxobutanoate hydroxymethyltransferase